MSCGAPATPSEKLSDILKPKTVEDKEAQSKSSSGELFKDKKSQPDAKSEYSLNINPGDKSEPNTQTNINQSAEPAPASQSGAPFPPTVFPAAPYNMPPNVGAFPIVYPPVMPPGQGFTAPPVMPPPGWTFAPVTASNAGNMTPAMPVNPYMQALPPTSQPLSSVPIDATLVNKRYEISLADLLKGAELISKPTLAAALKMQTLVQDGKVPVDEAINILKQHHQKGDSIDSYANSAASHQESAKSTSTSSIAKIKPISKEASAAFELLEKAGLLNKDDISTAKNVSRKHGGDLVSILKAAQKLDDKTFEAALTCVALLGEELMKLEQCIITLNYCSRSRVGFDEALEDLNWPNPRKG
jgi:hypothetical protein